MDMMELYRNLDKIRTYFGEIKIDDEELNDQFDELWETLDYMCRDIYYNFDNSGKRK